MNQKKKCKPVNSFEPFTVTEQEQIMLLQIASYTLKEIDKINKYYNLKTNGKKVDQIKRIICFLLCEKYVIQIQKRFRGHLIRNFFKMKGPGLYNRSLCTNESDFYSLEPLSEISNEQYIGYKDEDNFIYGFDIMSLYSLYKSSKLKKFNGFFNIQNPYNRNELPEELIQNLISLKIYQKHKFCPFQITFETKEETEELNLEMKCLALFQHINSLGNYSDAMWLLTLNKNKLLRFFLELHDIWNYRSGISIQTKQNICPPLGRAINIDYDTLEQQTEDEIKLVLIKIIENMTKYGINNDYKQLGSFYVLGALTIISSDASSALPYLVDAFSHN